MIKSLAIKRFKSIRSLSMPCRRVNLLIGAPDTGKTNVLEALHLLCRLGWKLPLDHSLRLSQELGFDTLFHRQFLDQPIEINTGEVSFQAKFKSPNSLAVLTGPPQRRDEIFYGASYEAPLFEGIRFYAYTSSQYWTYEAAWKRGSEVITPPHGANLMYIARHNEKVYEFLRDTAATAGRKLRFDQNTKKFRLSEVREDDILDYNLEVLSDSLRRFFFYGAVFMASRDAVLVLDEPDVFAFPPYPKLLGEMVADNVSNQFFLTTHNPYFLAGIVEKTPQEDLALFVASHHPEEGTQLKLLSKEEVGRLVEQGASVFFNLDDFLKP